MQDHSCSFACFCLLITKAIYDGRALHQSKPMIPCRPPSQDNSLQCAQTHQHREVWKSYFWPGVIIKLQCHSLFWCYVLQNYPKCWWMILKGTLLISSKRQICFPRVLKGALFIHDWRLAVLSHILLNSTLEMAKISHTVASIVL